MYRSRTYRRRRGYPTYRSRRTGSVRTQIRNAQRIARATKPIYDSLSFVGATGYNYLEILASASYNLRFMHFSSDETAFASGCEAFSQVILTPGRTDFFRMGSIEAFDTYLVRSIKWNYIPPATEADIGDYEDANTYQKQAYFPFSNCILRTVFDSTANVSSIQEIEQDMERYMKGPDDLEAQEIAISAIKGNNYHTHSSIEPKDGIIRRPSVMAFNAGGAVSMVRQRSRISTDTTWRLTLDGTGSVGTLAATYGTLSFLIPVFLNGFRDQAGAEVKRENLKWPVQQAFLNVTYRIRVFGTN